MDHVNVLNDHPELAPDVVKLLSNALNAARQNVKDLELKLEEQVRLRSFYHARLL